MSMTIPLQEMILVDVKFDHIKVYATSFNSGGLCSNYRIGNRIYSSGQMKTALRTVSVLNDVDKKRQSGQLFLNSKFMLKLLKV